MVEAGAVERGSGRQLDAHPAQVSRQHALPNCRPVRRRRLVLTVRVRASGSWGTAQRFCRRLVELADFNKPAVESLYGPTKVKPLPTCHNDWAAGHIEVAVGEDVEGATVNPHQGGCLDGREPPWRGVLGCRSRPQNVGIVGVVEQVVE